MPLVSLAIDYKQAESRVRSSFSLSGDLLPYYLDSLNSQRGVLQSLILSTCNRTELYIVLRKLKDLEHPINWWQNQARVQSYKLQEPVSLDP